MTEILINLEAFPGLNTPYNNGIPKLESLVPMSVLSLHLQLAMSKDNLLKAEAKSGFYLFRDSGIPKPRPATWLAWDRICRLGIPTSPYFYVPFLPSLRADDEIGVAITTRGTHLPSLSRRSKLHIKHRVQVAPDKAYESIRWGDVYIGQLPSDGIPDANRILTSYLDQSHAVESLILPRQHLLMEASQDPIRTRMESLASSGLLATMEYAMIAGLPLIKRLMFQTTTQRLATEWAMEYARVAAIVKQDPSAVAADYLELIHEEIEQRNAKPEPEEPANQVEKIVGESKLRIIRVGGNKNPKNYGKEEISSLDLEKF